MQNSHKITLQENAKKFQEMYEMRNTLRQMYDDRQKQVNKLKE